ncbi:hypothetical protein CALCODRAFT_511318 [Calocera cornea HHB12733]|uniref:Uncharacterized protein n=1 Tax=Calocera cornea HHB12733 TaxID=1353952 RepID=A0A165DV73_9BASI|nr:hypothetical protein CALCODRAFT_511318 [Calocera cornea HHB12733]
MSVDVDSSLSRHVAVDSTDNLRLQFFNLCRASAPGREEMWSRLVSAPFLATTKDIIDRTLSADFRQYDCLTSKMLDVMGDSWLDTLRSVIEASVRSRMVTMENLTPGLRRLLGPSSLSQLSSFLQSLDLSTASGSRASSSAFAVIPADISAADQIASLSFSDNDLDHANTFGSDTIDVSAHSMPSNKRSAATSVDLDHPSQLATSIPERPRKLRRLKAAVPDRGSDDSSDFQETAEACMKWHTSVVGLTSSLSSTGSSPSAPAFGPLWCDKCIRKYLQQKSQGVVMSCRVQCSGSHKFSAKSGFGCSPCRAANLTCSLQRDAKIAALQYELLSSVPTKRNVGLARSQRGSKLVSSRGLSSRSDGISVDAMSSYPAADILYQRLKLIESISDDPEASLDDVRPFLRSSSILAFNLRSISLSTNSVVSRSDSVSPS